MGKYWTIAKAAWQNIIEYRVNLIGRIVAHLFALLALIYLWQAIFAGRHAFGPYTLGGMISYFVMCKFLHFAYRGNTAASIADEIRQGDLSVYLLRPLNYLKFWFTVTLTERFFQAILESVVVVAFLIFLPQYFNFSLGSSNCLSFLVSIGLALILNFLLNILIAATAFWVTDIRLFHTSVILIARSLAGFIMPLDLFPSPLNKISMVLPFSYLLYFPIKIYQNSFSLKETLLRILFGFTWALALSFIAKFIWRRGPKHYEAVGR
jgi:ABC-2 type transport system permease protein